MICRLTTGAIEAMVVVATVATIMVENALTVGDTGEAEEDAEDTTISPPKQGYLIRAQRQLTQKRVAALPAEVKKELLTRKRDSEVARVIMPDAPPRKRRARLASPEREPCEFMEPECDSQRKKIIILEDIQLVPPKHAEIMANVEIHNIQQSPPGDVEIDEIQLSPPRDVEIQDLKPRDLLRIGNNMVAEADDEVTVTPSTSKQRTSIGVIDKNFDVVVGDWIKLTDDLSDCDMDTENEDCFLPVMTSRNATAEPAAETDMTLYETVQDNFGGRLTKVTPTY
ncbi:unnamed protein product [Parnassius apollo]|uniref:(apollo) hypothetical protein n=1 Tax=Parnassius apollo TaxID=110799 RepID=A0A8S3VYB9_PARAO|nr:unnamed protein product [Parnassius apollo]